MNKPVTEIMCGGQEEVHWFVPKAWAKKIVFAWCLVTYGARFTSLWKVRKDILKFSSQGPDKETQVLKPVFLSCL